MEKKLNRFNNERDATDGVGGKPNVQPTVEKKRTHADTRSNCRHDKTIQANYSYRIGSISPAIICESCGELIKHL